MNKENLVKVMNQIIQDPESWDQRAWHCSSKHCFFGWAQVLSGKPKDENSAFLDGKEWLELNGMEADWLCSGCRDLNEIYYFVSSVANGEYKDGYFKDGFNLYGYDSEGYDRLGMNASGYDRDGFDDEQYDRDGFHKNGFSEDGFDRNGMFIDPIQIPS